MFLFSFKATKQIPKCLNRSLETPGPADRRPREAFQLGVHKKRTGGRGGAGWGAGNAGARGGGGDPEVHGRAPRPALPPLPQPCVPAAAGSLLAGSLRPPKIPAGCPAEAGAGGGAGGRAALRAPRGRARGEEPTGRACFSVADKNTNIAG